MADKDPTPPPSNEVVTNPSGTDESTETVNRAMRKMAENAPDRMVELTTMMGAMSPMGHPLHQKMNEQHISKMLDLAVQHDTNEYELRKNQQTIDCGHENESRRLHVLYFLVFIGLMVFVLCMFKNQPAILVPILSGVGGAVTGFLGGVGYARSGMPGKKKSE